MFRISQYMREIAEAEQTGRYPTPAPRLRQQPGRSTSDAKGSTAQGAAGLALPDGQRRPLEGVGRSPAGVGPVVIWNLIRRCNLTCKHCYALSADHEYAGELSRDEVFTVMDDLKAFRVPVLILSGGEPLMRSDIFDIADRSRAMGFYTGLSTNGTLIDAPMADRIAATGFNYVGISLDGLRETHDKFRRLEGAFERSLAAVRRQARGVKWPALHHDRAQRTQLRAAAGPDAHRAGGQVLFLAPQLRRSRQHPPRPGRSAPRYARRAGPAL
jgi:sulfatase maturation enzyme AslB (radical SAM superfamily)